MGKQKQRQLNLKLYGHLYKRATGFDIEKCVYCGDRRYCFDHVPAIGLLSSIDVGEYLNTGGKLLLYPSCKDCNSFLGSTKQIGFYERLQELSYKYENKIGKMDV